MSRISKLVAAITANAAIVEEELRLSGHQEPDDDPMSPELDFPNIGPKGAKARVALLSAIHDLDRTIQSPLEYFRSFCQNSIETGSIKTLVDFKVPEMIPLHGKATYGELAGKTGLAADVLRTMIRASILSVGFFTEDNEERVGHTLSSAVFNSERRQQDRGDALRYMLYCMLNCGANLYHALSIDPTAQDTRACAFAVSHRGRDGKCPNFWEYLEKDPEMTTWFHAAMRTVATYPQRSTRFLVSSYDWASLDGKTVVELGGSTGQISAAIAKENPGVTFIAQDLAEAMHESKAISGLPPNVSLEMASFFDPQPRVADAYLLRTIFHSWANSLVEQIIRNIIPAMRHGAKMIVEEITLPKHKAIPRYGERNFSRADIIMTSLFNGRERSLDEFIDVVKKADERLVLSKVVQPAGSIMSIMEWEFMDPEHKNGAPPQPSKANSTPPPEKMPQAENTSPAAKSPPAEKVRKRGKSLVVSGKIA